MILVTGATGTVGREVVKQLLEAGHRPRVLVRDPAKVASLGDRVEVAHGDLEKPETLGPAVAGVKKVFLLALGPEMSRHEANAIDAAKAAGVAHVVKLSVYGIDEEPANVVAHWHRAGEAKLRASGMAWTMVRPGSFMANALRWLPTIRAQGAIFQASGDGKVPPIHEGDIAAVAVKALTTPGHEGKAYELTGSYALSVGEQAEILSQALGRTVRYVNVPPEAARDGMLKGGVPPVLVDALMAYQTRVREGRAADVSPVLEQVLGRKGRTFEEWARENARAFG